MNAVVVDRYGTPDVLRVEEVDRPEPGEGRVLVKVAASSVNPADWHFLTGEPRLLRVSFGGLRRPKARILGADVAGTVEAVGPGVSRFSAGDEVYGELGAGAFAEFASAPEAALSSKPANLTFEQAAAVPLAGLTALQGLRDHGALGDGRRVLVNGASGGVGTLAVQIAAASGAEVTGVCSTRNVEMVRSLGAARVIDYTREDYSADRGAYDAVFDLVGNRSVTANRRVLAPGGVYVASHGKPENRWLGPVGFLLRMTLVDLFTRGRSMKTFLARVSSDDLDTLREMIEAGEVAPVIDRTFRLDEIAGAFRHLETWHARGKVVVTI